MILKNHNGCEKSVDLVFKLEKNKKTYLVYKDKDTGKIYGGRQDKESLIPLLDNEIEILENILEKINRSE